MTRPTGPAGVTVETAYAYLEWAMQRGRGKETLALDQRGLDFLLEKHLPTKGLLIPPEGERFGGGRVFLGVAF